MTTITVKIEHSEELIEAQLHYEPSGAPTRGLASPGETKFFNQPDGRYGVSLSATGQTAGEKVTVTMTTPNNSRSHEAWIGEDRTITDMIDFGVDNGDVL